MKITKAELLDLLTQLEWVQPRYNGNPSCPCCGNQRHWKHAPDCLLALVVKSEEMPAKESGNA